MLKGIHMVTTEKNIQKNLMEEMVRELKLFIAKNKKQTKTAMRKTINKKLCKKYIKQI